MDLTERFYFGSSGFKLSSLFITQVGCDPHPDPASQIVRSGPLQILAFFRRRIVNTLGYTLAGLRFAWRSEEAFRIEVVLGVVLVPLALWLEPSGVGRALLIGSWGWVMVVELLNTALEKTVDRLSLERHPLSKSIKDLGSAAVGLSLVLALLVWVLVLF